MSFPIYKHYKESGVLWLGAIPRNWSTRRGKQIFEIKKRIAGSEGYTVLAVTQQGIRAKDIEGGDGQLSLDYSKYQLVHVGDFAMNHMDLLTGYVDISPLSGVTSPDYRVFSIKDRAFCFDRYYLYLLQAGYKNKIFFAFGQGSSQLGRWRFPTEQFNAFEFPCPPIEEQRQIVSFLDCEIKKLDALILEQQRLIQVLAEERQAVITRVLTKGLKPDIRMRNSGTKWLGKIPAHWSIKRLKYLSPRITVGIVIEPSKYYVDAGVPALRSLNIRQGEVTLENVVFISGDANEQHAKSRLRSGDLVSVRSGQPGATAVIPPELNECNCIDLIIIRKPTRTSEFFLCWYLASDAAIMQFSEGSDGAIQRHFNVETAKNLIVPEPPLEEQESIVDFVTAETAKRDALANEARRAIGLLQERRIALITTAVTGKIDVRAIAKTEPKREVAA